MTYDEAKLEVFAALVPQSGDVFIEGKQPIVIIPSDMPQWVSWITVKKGCWNGGGTTYLSEWWRRLNEGFVRRKRR